MRVLVIGSGLIGITSAYYLSLRGCEVTVVDRREGPCLETSFANGALLTPSMSEPWNTPGCWRALLSSLGVSDAPLQLHLRTLPSLARWGVRFLRNARPESFERNAVANLRLALHSVKAMRWLLKETAIDYGHRTCGSLRLFRDSSTLDSALKAANRLSSEGLRFRCLSAREAVVGEPALEPIANHIKGALYYESDEVGDAYEFSISLAKHASRLGVQFRFHSKVSSFEVRGNRLTAVVTESGRLVADRYVLASGSYCTPLLQQVGVRLPVVPAKGYSVTLDGNQHSSLLSVPVIDDQLHAVVVPLNGAIRVAGTAEFAGYDTSISPARTQNLIKLFERVLPKMKFDPASARPWCGLRAMSADGVPVIGATPLENLLVNTGHGHLGWTMAAGSGQLLADLICEQSPNIDPEPYALKRFA